jgi:hypothetical protein
MFGTKMNHFEDFSDMNEGERKLEDFERLKQLKEILQPTVKTREMKEDNEEIDNFNIGEKIMVKTLGMKSKLTRKFHGPYEVAGITKNGNYFLKNKNGNLLKRSYPPEHLKKIGVAQAQEDNVYEVEKIEEHRVNQGRLEYFVKWKNYPQSENTWEREDNFIETECLDDYWNLITQSGNLNVEVEPWRRDLLNQKMDDARMAQLVDRRTFKSKVVGSRPEVDPGFSRIFYYKNLQEIP